MELTSNAKGTIAFSVAMVVLASYCSNSAICMNSAIWEPALGILGPIAQFNGSLLLPLSTLIVGAAILRIWNGARAGFNLALLLGIATAVLYAPFGLAYIGVGSIAAALICFSVVSAGLLTASYAYKAQSGFRKVGYAADGAT
jgi:hypothetical protein